ncbi:MAG: hypothetical protein KKA79_06730 [Nanoarchaeota archaeon]|nr:hypothetical protein [Nanoarchaeota archaeon]MCG2718597.1 hypothetical protein [Nanoarchaeota archaeon]
MPSQETWFKYLISALAPTLTESLRSGDTDVLEGLQAIDTTIWMGVRASESIMNHLVRETLKKMDPRDPEGAHKVKHEILTVRNSWRGLQWHGVQNTLLTLRQLGLIRIYKDLEDIKEDGAIKAGYQDITLSPIWDPVIYEIKKSGIQRTIFGSIMGKLIGLTVAGKGVNALKLPVLIAKKAESNGGKIPETEIEEIVNASIREGERAFTDFEARDALKPENIRFFQKYDGEDAYVNPKVFIALKRLNAIALEIYNKMYLPKEG